MKRSPSGSVTRTFSFDLYGIFAPFGATNWVVRSSPRAYSTETAAPFSSTNRLDRSASNDAQPASAIAHAANINLNSANMPRL